jgi:DNA modification methylase
MIYDIVCGDCVKIMQECLHDECIDLTITSPPYDNMRTYNGYSFDFENVARQLLRVTKQGGVIVWIVGDETVKGSETGTSFRQALFFKEIGFNIHDTMIWNKGGFSAVGSLATRYGPVFEYMFVFTKGKLKTFNPIKDKPNKYAGKPLLGTVTEKNGNIKRVANEGKIIGEFGQRFNIWEISPHRGSNNLHPAQMAERIANDHIISWSNENDWIFDPFLGSGTTGKMALLNNRNFFGCDISQEYVDIAEARIIEALL